MPEETGLDTSLPIPATGWQDSGRNGDPRPPKRRRKKPPEPAETTPDRQPQRPQPADGVGTKLDVVV